MKEAAEQWRRFLPTNAQSPEVLKPADGSLHCPAPLVPSERATVLRLILRFAVLAMRRDQFNTLIGQLFAQLIAVIGFVADESLGLLVRQHEVKQMLHQLALMRIRRGRIHGQRQAAGINHHHDFHTFSRLRAADAVAAAPRLAEGAVNEAFIHAKAFAFLYAVTGIAHDLFEHAFSRPMLKPAMHGALRAEPARQILPFCAVVEHPEDAPKSLPLFCRRSTAQRTARRIGNPFHQPIELFVREFEHNDVIRTKCKKVLG